MTSSTVMGEVWPRQPEDSFQEQAQEKRFGKITRTIKIQMKLHLHQIHQKEKFQDPWKQK